MDNKTWDQVKQFYKDKFNIEDSMVELATNFDILKMCATGASNSSIANFLEIDEELVTSVIDKYLEFTGWSFDLLFSPYRVFSQLVSQDSFSKTLREDFIDQSGCTFIENFDVDSVLRVCHTVYYLERLLDEKWI